MSHDRIKIYYAKTQLPNGNRPTVKDHCDRVSQYAALYGQPLGMEEDARLAGLFHDFGKYSLTFDDVMQGIRSGIDHALCGAALIWSLQKRPKGIRYRAIIEAINGHHDGLQYIGSISSMLEANVIDEKPISINADKYSALSGKAQYQSAIDAFLRDHPGYRFPKLASNELVGMTNLEKMLYTRMLFSCLVDADYSVSAFEANEGTFSKRKRTRLMCRGICCHFIRSENQSSRIRLQTRCSIGCGTTFLNNAETVESLLQEASLP